MMDATPLLRLYARHRRARLQRENPAATQQAQLLALVARARHTKFGRDHGFERIRSVADFQARVPLRHYEDFWDAYWKNPFPVLRDVSWPGLIPYFALSSGTSTGRTKYIPVSREMNASNRRAALDILVHHASACPSSRVLAGKSFVLGGSRDLERLATGVSAGDLSGIAAYEVPIWARWWTFPPLRLALEPDWDRKVELIAPRSLGQDIRLIAGTPSWLLSFFDRLMNLRPECARRLVAFYPNLALVVHGGVSFAPYRHRFDALLDGSHAELREVYAASEGFVAIADGAPGVGLRIVLDSGLFYEFVPRGERAANAPTRHWIADAELGQDYALVLSSNAGAWAYVLGDTVRLVSRDPPRLVVTGRTTCFLSAFGEHLHGEEIEAAVVAAAGAIGFDVADFTVGTLVAARGDPVDAHLYLIEFTPPTPPEELRLSFAASLDAALIKANADYAVHRKAGQLGPPRVDVLPPGTFADWMRRRGKLGGQHKVPRTMNDVSLFENLRGFAAAYKNRLP